MDKDLVAYDYLVTLSEFLKPKTLSSAAGALPKSVHHTKRHVITFVPPAEINNKKSDSLLLLKLLHKFHLMLMYILQRKSI